MANKAAFELVESLKKTFAGGSVAVGDATLDIAARLEEGNGYIVTDDESEIRALDGHDAVKRTQIGGAVAAQDADDGLDKLKREDLDALADDNDVDVSDAQNKGDVIAALREAGVSANGEDGEQMPAIENRIGDLWLAKQTAKGSPAAAANAKAGRWVAGDVALARDDGSENYLDGERYANAADFINTIVGNGNPTFQAQPGFTAFLAYLMLGQETVSTPITELNTDVYEHVATPAAAGGFWATAFKKVGESVGPLREQHNDCRFTSWRIEGSSAAKVAKVLPAFTSIDPANKYLTDPADQEEVDEPLLHTESEGQFKIDAGDGTLAVFRGLSSFAAQINDNVSPWYGDSVFPFDVVYGLGNIVIEGISILVDAAGLELFNYILYGSKTPPPGSKPRVILPPFGAYEFNMRRGSINRITVTGSPTGGNTAVTYRGQTATIPWNSTAPAVQTLLEGLSNLEPGEVTVHGGPLPATPIVVKFTKDAGVLLTKVDAFTGGTAPASTIVDLGAHRQVKVELPNVKWNPDLSIPANPDGGATELGLGAEVRRVSPDPFIRITTRSGEAAFV